MEMIQRAPEDVKASLLIALPVELFVSVQHLF
jgi:hypothetical protein